jgi:hypothetical protein
MSDINYAQALVYLRPGAEWSMSGNDPDTLVWHDDDTPPTKAELDAAASQAAYERAFAEVEEARRARYQSGTDGLFFEAQREGGDLTVWAAAVDAIKADLPYPVQP